MDKTEHVQIENRTVLISIFHRRKFNDPKQKLVKSSFRWKNFSLNFRLSFPFFVWLQLPSVLWFYADAWIKIRPSNIFFGMANFTLSQEFSRRNLCLSLKTANHFFSYRRFLIKRQNKKRFNKGYKESYNFPRYFAVFKINIQFKGFPLHSKIFLEYYICCRFEKSEMY